MFNNTSNPKRENNQLIKLFNLATNQPNNSNTYTDDYNLDFEEEMSFANISDDYRLIDDSNIKDKSFNKLISDIQNSIEEFHNLLNVCNNVVKLIGTSKDNDSLRHKLSATLESCTSKGKEIHNSIERLPIGNDKNKKQQQSKLSSDFLKLRSEFQNISTLSKQRQQAAIKTMQQNLDTDRESYQNENYNDRRNQQMQEQESIRMAARVEQNRAIILERQAEYQAIERDIVQIDDIFKDLNMLVLDQGIAIDNIESNIITSKDMVRKGNDELYAANEYQKSARSKMCCIATVVIVVVLVLVLVLTKAV